MKRAWFASALPNSRARAARNSRPNSARWRVRWSLSPRLNEAFGCEAATRSCAHLEAKRPNRTARWASNRWSCWCYRIRR